MRLSLKSVLLSVLVAGAASGAGAAACEMKYSLAQPGAKPQAVKEGAVIELKAGTEYSLTLSYFEDHRNCLIGPEATAVTLDGRAWSTRTPSGLALLETTAWKEAPARTQSSVLRFVASEPGSYVIGVERACPKGGYSGAITIKVS